jgi:hypothetical protein
VRQAAPSAAEYDNVVYAWIRRRAPNRAQLVAHSAILVNEN